jgi:hypothetical protein
MNQLTNKQMNQLTNKTNQNNLGANMCLKCQNNSLIK